MRRIYCKDNKNRISKDGMKSMLGNVSVMSEYDSVSIAGQSVIQK